jgi:regulator of sigma E protease
MPLTTIVSIDDRPVGDWRSLWIALRELTQAAHERGEGTALTLTVAHPTPGEPREDLEFSLTADEVRDLHELTWHCEAPSVIFDAIYTVRSADGDPLKALLMGVQETHKLIMMTYLTIDRLLRRTVPVEQLRGPVGIFHIGVNIADRGFIYVLFFLGMISVNLAVINFLPLPIVDGGLFLFLVYEKLKGRPPSVRFQEAVTIVGLVLIATMFIVVTYNDVMRLFT